MARRVQDDESEAPNREVRIPGEKEFNALIKKLNGSQSRLDEAKGEMGNAVDKAISQHNFHKDALRVVRKYLKKDPAAASEFKAHLDTYWVHGKLSLPEDDMIEGSTRKSRRAPRAENVVDLPQPEAAAS